MKKLLNAFKTAAIGLLSAPALSEIGQTSASLSAATYCGQNPIQGAMAGAVTLATAGLAYQNGKANKPN